jgi:hypothetical protein
MRLLLLFILAFTMILANAQPVIQWQKCLGGSAGDWAQSVQVTVDGGYIVAGYTSSNDSDVSSNHGNDDFWVAKLNSTGMLEWQKCLGGSQFDQSYSIQQTADSGYVVTGFSASNDGDVTANQGNDDYWIVKLNGAGTLQWQKNYGGSSFDDALSIRQTTDGGYIVAGDTESNDGDVTGSHGGYDVWLVKLDSTGNLQWQKCLGGSTDDTAASIQQTSDGGYIVGGSTLSNNGDVTGNHGNWDYWIVKLNDTAGIQWQKCLGGAGQDIGYSIQETTDSGYVVAGFTRSTDGDVTGLHGTATQPDHWVVKLSNAGSLLWQKCLGGSYDDKAYSIQQTQDGGYIVAGYTKSNDGDVTGNHATNVHDEWIVKLTDSGNLEWQKCLGGSGEDWARSIQQTVDGYIVAGFTASNDGDVTGNHGGRDYWIVKLDTSTTGISEMGVPGWHVFPNPSAGIFSITGDLPIQGGDLTIFNALGQLVHQSPIHQEKTLLDLSAAAPGLYFILIADETHSWTGRMIIE